MIIEMILNSLSASILILSYGASEEFYPKLIKFTGANQIKCQIMTGAGLR